MRATLTINGLYNYDNSLFDNWTLPAGVERYQLIDMILYECSGLELTLPNPDLFKRVTGLWTQRKARAWTRALDAMKAEYNPIHNYDRTETLEEEESGSGGRSDEASGTSTETTAAFNSSSYSPKNKVQSSSEAESSSTFGRDHSHTIRASGNIGVTTSQQMVEAEMNLAEKLDIYQVITQDFKKEFCVMVY